MYAVAIAAESGQGDGIRQFFADLGLSLAAWRRAPMLPVSAVALNILLLAPALLSPVIAPSNPRTASPTLAVLLVLSCLNLAVLAFYIGSLGTQRVWYVHAFRGETLTPGEFFRLTLGFIGRFSVLGVVVAIPYLVVGEAVYIVTIAPQSPIVFMTSTSFAVTLTVLTIAVDLLLTFVTPALALHTRHVSDALKDGFAMIRETWPGCAVYVLCPPLTLQLSGNLLPRPVAPWFYVAYAIVSTLVYMLFKGAITAFYVRHRPVDDTDAAGAWPGAVSAEAVIAGV